MTSVREAWQNACPMCGADDQIDIGATVYVRLCPDGTDTTTASNGDHEWDNDCTALCCACGHAATVGAFETRRRS